jgi:hypothetical protein
MSRPSNAEWEEWALKSRFCNSISPRKTYSCERDKDHDGRCQAENLDRGGYVFWEKPEEPEPYDGIMWGDG